MRSFVFGNGKSRLNISFDEVKPYGTVYACNAVYREYAPDHLIAVDPKMIVEICESKYQLTNEVWTNPNIKFDHYENLNFFKNSRGWSSGPTALHKACIDRKNEIYILGFDYYGIGDKFNNVYADTEFYKKSSNPPTYTGNWANQLVTIMRDFPDIMFVRVMGPTTAPIKNFDGIVNYRTMEIAEFQNRINNTKDL